MTKNVGKHFLLVALLSMYGYAGYGFSMDHGKPNYHCHSGVEACKDRCDQTACKHQTWGWSRSCKSCYDACDREFESCMHYQNICGPQYMACKREAHGDETLIRECRRDYLRCKAEAQ